ncbi:MAG: diacylglycerol kinase family protein [Anaerolineales bacterium]
MEHKKTIFIINPNANMGQAWRQAADLRPIMQELGDADWAGSVYPTHAIELTKKAVEDGYELIIAGGGDGTVHEVVNALMTFPKEKRPILGVVPLGSGNDFSFSMGMDTEPWKALRQIIGGEEKWIDIGEIEDDTGRKEYFDNTVGIGFNAIVTIHSHKMPLLRGYLMYIAAVLKTIFLNHHPIAMNITIDGQEEWQDSLMMLVLCNGGREGGGFLIYPPADNSDGLFHYVAVKEVSRLIMLRLLPAFMTGSHLTHPKIASGDFKSVNIEADQPMFIHLDGEIFSGFSSNIKNIKVKLHHKALRVIS